MNSAQIYEHPFKGNNSNFSLRNDVDIIAKIDRLKRSNVKVIKNYNTRNRKTNYSDISKDGFISVNCRSCGFLFDSIIELRDHLKDEHPEILNQPEKAFLPPSQKLFSNNEYSNNDESSDEDYFPEGNHLKI